MREQQCQSRTKSSAVGVALQVAPRCDRTPTSATQLEIVNCELHKSWKGFRKLAHAVTGKQCRNEAQNRNAKGRPPPSPPQGPRRCPLAWARALRARLTTQFCVKCEPMAGIFRPEQTYLQGSMLFRVRCRRTCKIIKVTQTLHKRLPNNCFATNGPS